MFFYFGLFVCLFVCPSDNYYAGIQRRSVLSEFFQFFIVFVVCRVLQNADRSKKINAVVSQTGRVVSQTGKAVGMCELSSSRLCFCAVDVVHVSTLFALILVIKQYQHL